MLVRDIMNPEVTTVTPQTSLADAYQTMRAEAFRHLVVVDEGRVVGIVTDRDLRLATSELHPRPFRKDAAVGEVMVRHPITTSPRDPVEEAAHLMRERRIGCLPVVDGDELVGIITNTDLLDAVVRLTGLHKPGGRIAVLLPDEPGRLGALMTSVGEKGVNVHSVLTYQDETDAQADALKVILRIGTLNGHRLAQALRSEGFDVRWPKGKEALWSR